jgi:hypothetical protein
MFFRDFGSETLRSDFNGRRESVRLLRATPPAIPASAAPPATSGVFALEAMLETFRPVLRTEPAWGFAFEASSATFSPVLPIAPFEAVLRARDWDALLRRELLFPRELALRPFEVRA